MYIKYNQRSIDSAFTLEALYWKKNHNKKPKTWTTTTTTTTTTTRQREIEKTIGVWLATIYFIYGASKHTLTIPLYSNPIKRQHGDDNNNNNNKKQKCNKINKATITTTSTTSTTTPIIIQQTRWPKLSKREQHQKKLAFHSFAKWYFIMIQAIVVVNIMTTRSLVNWFLFSFAFCLIRWSARKFNDLRAPEH